MKRQGLVAGSVLLSTWLAAGAARADRAPAPQCPPGERWPEVLQARGEGWTFACQAERDGTVMLAALRQPADDKPAPKAVLVVAVTAPRQPPQRLQIKLDARQLSSDEGARLQIAADKLGVAPVVRITYSTQLGEDYYSASELVTFVVRTAAGLQHVWTGTGSSESRSMDLCYTTSTARFALSPDGSLQRTVRTTYSINRANYHRDQEVLRNIVKECRGAPVKTTRFPLSVKLP